MSEGPTSVSRASNLSFWGALILNGRGREQCPFPWCIVNGIWGDTSDKPGCGSSVSQARRKWKWCPLGRVFRLACKVELCIWLTRMRILRLASEAEVMSLAKQETSSPPCVQGWVMHLVNQGAYPPSRKRGGSDVPCKGRVFRKAEVMRSTDGA